MKMNASITIFSIYCFYNGIQLFQNKLIGDLCILCKVEQCVNFFLSHIFSTALPPPPLSDEDASTNYFNLAPTNSPVVMNLGLPPPPGVAMPPPPGEFHPTHFLLPLFLYSE